MRKCESIVIILSLFASAPRAQKVDILGYYEPQMFAVE